MLGGDSAGLENASPRTTEIPRRCMGRARLLCAVRRDCSELSPSPSNEDFIGLGAAPMREDAPR